MSNSEGRKTLFPSEWGWERFERGVREHAAQCARHEAARGAVPEEDRSRNQNLIWAWDDRQVLSGSMPSYRQRGAKGEAYQDIFDGLKKEAMEALGRGELGAAGTAHCGPEYQRQHAPEPELRVRLRRRAEPGLER